MDYAQDEKKIFLAEITKTDDQLSESFYFIKTYVLTELWFFFYLHFSDVSVKKVSFPAKAAVFKKKTC